MYVIAVVTVYTVIAGSYLLEPSENLNDVSIPLILCNIFKNE